MGGKDTQKREMEMIEFHDRKRVGNGFCSNMLSKTERENTDTKTNIVLAKYGAGA